LKTKEGIAKRDLRLTLNKRIEPCFIKDGYAPYENFIPFGKAKVSYGSFIKGDMFGY